MGKIDLAVIKEVYISAKNVYFKKTTLTDETNCLTERFPVKKSSMADYIYDFKHMMNGVEYKRTMNYYETLTNITMKKQRLLLAEFSKL